MEMTGEMGVTKIRCPNCMKLGFDPERDLQSQDFKFSKEGDQYWLTCMGCQITKVEWIPIEGLDLN